MANLLQGLGQAQPVSQFIGTAMQYGQYQQNSALRGMQAQREQLALDEAQKQQEHLDTIVDFRLTPFYLGIPESSRPQAEQMFKGLGAFDENFRGTRRQMYSAIGEIEKSAPALKALTQPILEAKAQNVVKTFQAMQKNPNDPKLAEAYKTAQMEHAASSGKLLDYIKTLEAEAPTFHNIPEGGTGVLINERGEQIGEPILGAPKQRKSDPFTTWADAYTTEHGNPPSAREILAWHRSTGAASADGNAPAKIGQLGMVNRELAGRYLPFAKQNLEGKGDTNTYENVLAMLTTTDQFGGTVNDARLREALLPHQRTAYDSIKTKAQNYARTMNPAEAVDKAIADYWKKHPSPKTASPPAGYSLTDRYHEGKRLYHNPQAPKGREYWTAE